MTITTPIRRPLGTMIVYGYPRATLGGELAIAHRIGASLLEILPDWRAEPDPRDLVTQVRDAGLAIHSAHGCWGGQTIRARQVDLASLDPTTRAASLDDIRRCVDWVQAAEGSFLVVHPGGLSDPVDLEPRRAALVASLQDLAPLAESARVVVCVENMPPGVHPGSRMADLAAVVAEVASPAVALALDTGHAAMAEAEATDQGFDLGATTGRRVGSWRRPTSTTTTAGKTSTGRRAWAGSTGTAGSSTSTRSTIAARSCSNASATSGRTPR